MKSISIALLIAPLIIILSLSENSNPFDMVNYNSWVKATLIFLFLLLLYFVFHLFTSRLKKQLKKFKRLSDEYNVALHKKGIELEESKQKTLELLQIIKDQKTHIENKSMENIRKDENLLLMSKKLNDANEQKLAYLNKISHEFRTPITLITEPIKRYISVKSNKIQVEKKVLLLIYRNSLRLLHLVNKLIDTSSTKKTYDDDYIDSLPGLEQPEESFVESPDESLPRLLIIMEDEDIVIYLSNEFVTSYMVCTVKDGLAGFEKALEEIPDIIICDSILPNVNGLELCEKLKTNLRTAHIPIIILTAKTGEDIQLSRFNAEIDDYIMKPFNIDTLKRKITILLENRQKLRELYENNHDIAIENSLILSADQRFLRKAVRYIKKNMSNSDYSEENLATDIGFQIEQLKRKIKAITNQSVKNFILTIRLKHSAQLLLNNCGDEKEIAKLSGFPNFSSFKQSYTEYFGTAPETGVKVVE